MQQRDFLKSDPDPTKKTESETFRTGSSDISSVDPDPSFEKSGIQKILKKHGSKG